MESARQVICAVCGLNEKMQLCETDISFDPGENFCRDGNEGSV